MKADENKYSTIKIFEFLDEESQLISGQMVNAGGRFSSAAARKN